MEDAAKAAPSVRCCLFCMRQAGSLDAGAPPTGKTRIVLTDGIDDACFITWVLLFKKKFTAAEPSVCIDLSGVVLCVCVVLLQLCIQCTGAVCCLCYTGACRHPQVFAGPGHPAHPRPLQQRAGQTAAVHSFRLNCATTSPNVIGQFE